MRNRYLRSSPLARLSLFVAALLYLAGAAADPLVHAYETRTAGAESVWEGGTEGGSPETELPAPESELDCFLCKALGAATLPESARVVPELAGEPALLNALSQLHHCAPDHSLPQPRGPPLA